MSHLEKFDAVIHGTIKPVVKPTSAAPFMRMFADMKKLFGSLVLLFAGVLVLASCGGGGSGTTITTSSTTSATIAPFKGPYSSGAVTLKDANGNPISLLSGGTINASGTANVAYDANVAYPLTVEVTGSYYNEVTAASETSTVPLRGLIASATAAASTPVTIVTETAVADLENRLGVPSAANPLPAAAAVAALNTAGTMLGIPATAVPVFDPITHKTSDANTLNLAALAVHANGQTGLNLAEKVKVLANGLAQSTIVISQANMSAALAQVTTGGAHNMMAPGAATPVAANISATSYAAHYANAGATAYPNLRLLVSAASLNVAAANQVIIDTRSAAEYSAGHITNAINLEPSALDTTPTSHDLNTPTLAAAVLSAAGVSNKATIIVYGKNGDFGVKERVFWALEYLGANDVHMLDGGYAAWIAVPNTAQIGTPTLTAATFTPAVAVTRLATKADVLAHYADTTNYAIVDSRFIADYNTAHIPNATNILMTDFTNADGTTKPYAAIRALLDAKGVTAGKKIITHCYVGYMSGQGYFMSRLMGLNVSNYDGSWTEWAADATPLPQSLPLLLSPAALNVAAANQVIIDVRSAVLFATNHIPGAINITTAMLDTTATSTALDAINAPITLGNAGVAHTANIVVYSASTDASAGRVLWALEYLGARNVSVLNGGYAAWINTTYHPTYNAATMLQAGLATQLPTATFTASLDATRLATKADVLAHYADTANYSIVDSRNYDDTPSSTANGNYVTNHIPNAVSILTQHFDDPVSPFNVLPLTSAALTTPAPGSGCTLNIAASAIVTGPPKSGGAITAVTVNAGGTGYSVGSILMVEGGNHAALVKVASVGAGGAVTGVTFIAAQPGALYVTGTVATTRDYSSLTNVLSANGITAGKTIITNCYVGYRSGFEYFIFRLMGYNVSNYDGSWVEWQADTTPLPTKAGTLP